MNHRAEYLLQVLEKIGSPLLASVIDVQARGRDSSGPSLQNEAQRIAELIARTVQASIDLSHCLDLGPTGTMTDSIRVALTALAGPMVAGAFKSSGKAPGENDIKRLVAAMQAVLTFAENFSADDENTGRLRDVGALGQPADAVQAQVQYFHAFIPVIHAVSGFSFGQPERKFILDVAARLTAKATQLRAELFGDRGPDNLRIERAILQGLARIYTAGHEAETVRILGLGEDERAQMSGGMAAALEGLWNNFELRVAMLAALGQGMTGKSSNAGSTAPAPVASAAAAQEGSASPLSMFVKKPDETPAAPPPPQAPAQNVSNPAANPMAFFKSPPKSTE